MAKHRRTRDRAVTCRTLFSGGELAGVGIGAAGFEHRPGIEIDPAIAAVAAANGMPPLVANVLDVDPATLEPTDAAHFSSPCTRASTANQSAELNDDGTKEAPLDIAMGEWVARYIDVLAPSIVTVENVYAYRNFKAFKLICAALTRQGYFWDYDHLNAADYGVPQTRKRLILRAVKGRLLPHLPAPEPWGGWYAAIEDLIPTLPASKFAAWQLARLPEELREHGVMVDSQNAGQEFGKLYRTASEPAVTVVAVNGSRPSHMPRAFILAGGGNTNLAEASPGRGVRYGAEPMHSVTPVTPDGGSMPRAWLVKSADKWANIPSGDEPAFTITSEMQAGSTRAWLSAGRVVSMTPRALARFQSVPDWYVLPEKAGLACKVIGNGWPCLMAEKIYRGLRPG